MVGVHILRSPRPLLQHNLYSQASGFVEILSRPACGVLTYSAGARKGKKCPGGQQLLPPSSHPPPALPAPGTRHLGSPQHRSYPGNRREGPGSAEHLHQPATGTVFQSRVPLLGFLAEFKLCWEKSGRHELGAGIITRLLLHPPSAGIWACSSPCHAPNLAPCSGDKPSKHESTARCPVSLPTPSPRGAQDQGAPSPPAQG